LAIDHCHLGFGVSVFKWRATESATDQGSMTNGQSSVASS
jgi:hypothetical protein